MLKKSLLFMALIISPIMAGEDSRQNETQQQIAEIIITEIILHDDGGTIAVKTKSGDFYIDNRIMTKTKGIVFHSNIGGMRLRSDELMALKSALQNSKIPEAKQALSRIKR